MGALKDIVDLCIKLRDEIGERKSVEVIGKIQSLTLSLQSEHVALVEKNSELVIENLNLKRKLQEQDEKHVQELANIRNRHQSDLAAIHNNNIANKGGGLDAKSIEILKWLFDTAHRYNSSQTASKFNLTLNVAQYHLDELEKREFVALPTVFTSGTPDVYRITEKGRKYIVENGLAT